jgi:hypothetical protein
LLISVARNTFRKRFITVATIDNLFGILNDPLVLFSWDSMRTMPLGFVLALLFWSIPIATIFPPGALTVIPLEFHVISSLPVPFYNNSAMGDGSAGEVVSMGLFDGGYITSDFDDTNYTIEFDNG